MYASTLDGNREIPGLTGSYPESALWGKARSRTPDMHGPGKSDGGIVSMKQTNKGAQPCRRRGHRSAESVEKSPPAKGDLVQTTVTGTQRLESALIGLDRVREAAQRFCV